jgi:23S rRNA (cytosine1962-C5)-methyltransferase
MAVLVNPPCIVFEDDHLLVVNKPPGWNTHSPAPYAGEGIYEWLKNREPRWSKLAIIHRLDKETSGLLVFSKTTEANKSLTQQFTEGKVRKEYVLRSFTPPPKPKMVVRSTLKRAGERYVSEPGSVSGAYAETEFEVIGKNNGRSVVIARPRTGRTHQIRVHASENGFAIEGDELYGGAQYRRLCLHARRIEFAHPVLGEALIFEAADNFVVLPEISLREACIQPAETNAYRLLHGASERDEELFVDRFGPFALVHSPKPPIDSKPRRMDFTPMRGIYQKTTAPSIRGKSADETSPRHISDEKADGPFPIRENGVQYEINFNEGYSVGIFLDQRDNRRRLLTNYISPDFWVREDGMKSAEVLNTFAYTCAFSVCAAFAGAHVTSLDLSKNYLEWGKRNFELNGLKPDAHDFIYGDVFDWLRRLAKKGRQFDVALLDPPTFSKSKESGLFRAEHDYTRLVGDALKVLRPNGTLFASSNAARWEPEDFVRTIREAVAKANRNIVREHYVPQPPDFPISKAEPAYLKTLWLKIT